MHDATPPRTARALAEVLATAPRAGPVMPSAMSRNAT